ncbi:sigma-54 dependent transcriptional regulator [Pseudoruegeria sp. SK021]|uniref:sigma-54-dependent transcriptional regulator n=1 Tax=Pseudoruegeria sp. SK021 TaxID=1933035 RepID=UPI000A21A976|nr:sigma-54 dependent transcriptional regulator [Pseudoruegeria sp. SK021]OSP55963.1 Fis family transcriptional regulator [Pseudoruegeria sp. SK021]
MTACPILLIDDDEDIRLSAQQALELRGHTVTAFARADRALDRLGPQFPGVVVSDIRMPRMDGLQFLEAALALDPDQPVILITGHGDVPLAVEALNKGAYDFIEKPFSMDHLGQSILRAAEKRRMTLELRAMTSDSPPDDPLDGQLLGRAPAVVELRRKVRATAETDLDVLIVGQTGTGKELVARSIHGLSDRRDKPFVAINLAALPAASLEAELFGHTAGAFPGAIRARTGRLEHARGGTVYLDEIGSTPLSVQVKLLRTLKDRAIEPLGSSDRVDLNVRFIASTRDALEGLVQTGQFRDDLLYRLNPVTLRLPALRERPEDVPRLFQHFVSLAARRYRRDPITVAPERLMQVSGLDWPGNLRELKSAADRHVLGIDSDLPGSDTIGQSLADQIDRFEKQVLCASLSANDGNLKATYESLGLSRKTLYEKMQKHGLRRDDFGD